MRLCLIVISIAAIASAANQKGKSAPVASSRSPSPSPLPHVCHTDENGWCVFAHIESKDDLGRLSVSSDKPASETRKVMFESSTIRTFSSSVCNALTQLQSLDLKTLSVVNVLEDALSRCTELKWLSLHGNSVGTLAPKTFQHNAKLEHIFLSENRLKFIDCNLFKSQTRLLEFHIAVNQLPEFPFESLRWARDLTTLSFHSNYIVDLDEELLLRQFPHLQTVWLSGNELACARLLEIKAAFQKRNVEMKPHHYQITRFYETSKVDGSLCLPDEAWAAVHYRKTATGRLGRQNCQ